MVKKIEETKWHTMKADDVLKAVYSKKDGITDYEARIRLDRYGPNIIEETHKRSAFISFVDQFKSVLVIILIIAIFISAFLGELIDSAVILSIIVLNAILGFLQERKAEKALEALRKLSTPTTVVVRNKEIKTIQASELVPGDILLLKVGDIIPADCRIMEQTNLKTDESILTGESIPVSKTEIVIKDLEVAERKNMLFSGTTIVYGKCKAIVISTGMKTEFGKIAEDLQQPQERTPLQHTLDKLGLRLGAIFVGISIITFIIGYLIGIDFVSILLLSIALAVAAVPEGLPAAVTLSLAIGVQKMASKNSIIRRLSSVETLGCTTYICTDKTGTLTMNQMTVKKLYVDDKVIEITGEGYEINGKFLHNQKTIDPKKFSDIQLLLASGMLCNDAILTEKTKIGDPTELALIVSAKKSGLLDLRNEYKRYEEIEFTSERRMMTVGYEIGKKKIAYSKGAVEEILKKSSYIYDSGRIRKITLSDIKKITSINNLFTKDALRVLGFAIKKYSQNQKISEKDLIFIGLQAMIDPPRPDVKEAVEKCKKAGIKVVMITGDHKETALSIARQTSIIDSEYKMLTGNELDKLSEKEFKDVVENIVVYARTSPQHKVRITETLRSKSHVIAMTGDGINDAPALKKADIGIAMGKSGTDVAKEAGDMTLIDDSFSTIVSAVKEGRGIYTNIKKTLAYLLSGNIAEVMIIFLSVIISFIFSTALPIPLIAIQLLWINLVTDGIPALALSVDHTEEGLMNKKPRSKEESIFKDTRQYIIDFPIIITIGVLSLFIWSFSYGDIGNVIKAQTIAFTSIVVFEMFAAFSCRSLDKPIGRKIFNNKLLVTAVVVSIILQLVIIYHPIFNSLFHTTPLFLIEWLLIAAAGLIGFIYLETSKYLSNRVSSKEQ